MADPLTLAAVGWGISTAGWIISPIITRLLNKAFSHINSDESEKLRHLETNILPRLALTLEAVEGSERRSLFEQLVRELKSAFYEVEDILDDVEYCRLEKQLTISSKKRKNASDDGAGPSNQDVGSKSSWTRPGHLKSRLKGMVKKVEKPIDDAQKIIGLANLPSNNENGNRRPEVIAPDPPCKDVGCKSSWTMPGPLKSDLKKMLKKIEKLIDEAQKIIGLANLPSDHRPEVTAKYVQKPTAADPPRKVTGRDEDRQQIISMLRENPSSSGGKNFSVIGIHGIPGSGKTTLAQHVCEYEEKESYFDLVMWVHVSQNFRVDTIFSEMIEQAIKKPCPQFKGLTALQKHLKEELRGKRFLLVLDDVWHSKDLSPEELSPLEVGKAGSKILVTSRTSDALSALCAVRCIPMPELDEHAFLELFMHYALEGARLEGQDRRIFETIGADIAKRLKRSPLLARTVGGQLRRRPNVDFWRGLRDRDVLTDTEDALWWSYQHLDEQARRCFAYCSIFPRTYQLKRDELVNFWVAEGFIKATEIGEEMEGIAQDYFDELVSTSFLQLRGKDYYDRDYYTIHDLLHDLAEKVAGSDCFRIENGWTGEVPRDVRHLFVETCNRALLAEKILKLENLRTLIIESGTMKVKIEKKDFESMFTRLWKLRILSVREIQGYSQLSIPASIGQLKHIRYLAIKTSSYSDFKLDLPNTFTKLYHMQVLDFGYRSELVFNHGQDVMSNLINLRHILASSVPNIIRLTSLQTLPFFRVRKEPGYELRQLRDLNKLRGSLEIHGLENVGSKEEALEANLAGKERITELHLEWEFNRLPSSNAADLEAEILEGLCPPMGLEELEIVAYKGSRYPDWMVGNKNGPKHLQRLQLDTCSPLEAIPDTNEFFLHLHCLQLEYCMRDALPDNMEQLTSLKELLIDGCENIQSLPTLPQSLEDFEIIRCNENFMSSCETPGHPNWEKLKHVPNKAIIY